MHQKYQTKESFPSHPIQTKKNASFDFQDKRISFTNQTQHILAIQNSTSNIAQFDCTYYTLSNGNKIRWDRVRKQTELEEKKDDYIFLTKRKPYQTARGIIYYRDTTEGTFYHTPTETTPLPPDQVPRSVKFYAEGTGRHAAAYARAHPDQFIKTYEYLPLREDIPGTINENEENRPMMEDVWQQELKELITDLSTTHILRRFGGRHTDTTQQHQRSSTLRKEDLMQITFPRGGGKIEDDKNIIKGFLLRAKERIKPEGKIRVVLMDSYNYTKNMDEILQEDEISSVFDCQKFSVPLLQIDDPSLQPPTLELGQGGKSALGENLYENWVNISWLGSKAGQNPYKHEMTGSAMSPADVASERARAQFKDIIYEFTLNDNTRRGIQDVIPNPQEEEVDHIDPMPLPQTPDDGSKYVEDVESQISQPDEVEDVKTLLIEETKPSLERCTLPKAIKTILIFVFIAFVIHWIWSKSKPTEGISH